MLQVPNWIRRRRFERQYRKADSEGRRLTASRGNAGRDREECDGVMREAIRYDPTATRTSFPIKEPPVPTRKAPPLTPPDRHPRKPPIEDPPSPGDPVQPPSPPIGDPPRT